MAGDRQQRSGAERLELCPDTACHAFYPPLIRLQHTAPSPQGRRVLWLLLWMFGFLFVWAIVGKLDIVAVADGKLIPESYLKIVQPAEAGIVKEILVQEGEHVKAGQVLMRMDELYARADLEVIIIEQARKQLSLMRIEAELEGRPFHVDGGFSDDIASEAEAQFQANRDTLLATLAEEQSRMVKAEKELDAANQLKTRLEAVLPHYYEQEATYDKLVRNGYAGTLAGSDKRRERIEKEQELAMQEHLIASAQASIDQSRKRMRQIETDYRRQLHEERVEAKTQLGRLDKELEKLTHRRSLLELRAPQDGIVKELATRTPGTVVQPGTVLTSMVPLNERLKVEAWISNSDIGFVHAGQSVRLKFAPYPFQKYGMGHGTVEYISVDAQSEEEARNAGLQGAAQASLRYKALIALEDNMLEVDGVQYPLAVGMHTTTEIVLGRRTVAEYLLSPIQKAWHEAGRER